MTNKIPFSTHAVKYQRNPLAGYFDRLRKRPQYRRALLRRAFLAALVLLAAFHYFNGGF